MDIQSSFVKFYEKHLLHQPPPLCNQDQKIHFDLHGDSVGGVFPISVSPMLSRKLMKFEPTPFRNSRRPFRGACGVVGLILPGIEN